MFSVVRNNNLISSIKIYNIYSTYSRKRTKEKTKRKRKRTKEKTKRQKNIYIISISIRYIEVI